jgi:hypothetical protein
MIESVEAEIHLDSRRINSTITLLAKAAGGVDGS